MLNSLNKSPVKTKQRGAAAVEFGIIAILFFTVFFGIIEFGRVFYLFNTVQEVTRCAARKAAVTWKDDWDDIPQQCMFGHDQLVLGWEIHATNVQLRALNLSYEDANPGNVDENISNCTESPSGNNCIRFVEARVGGGSNGTCQPIPYQPMFGLLPLPIGIPCSTVRMPAENLGFLTND